MKRRIEKMLVAAAVAFACAGGAVAKEGVSACCWRNERVLVRMAVAKGDRVQAVSDLRTAAGATIPAAAVKVRVSSDPVPALGFAGDSSAWLDVSVPRDATPGAYRGKVTVAAAGGTSVRDIALDVRYDVLPDCTAWPAEQLTNAWLVAFAAANGVTGDLRAFAREPIAAFLPQRELVREAVEDFAKIGILVENGRTMWQMSRALTALGKDAQAKKTAADWQADLRTVGACIDEVSLMGELNGRTVECSVDAWGEADGYATPIRSVRILQHPTKEWDRPGRPLYVVLHSAGHNAPLAANCTRTRGNHDIYRAPDDFFALYLDCSGNGNVDWWWGYKTKPGFDLSACERRLEKAIEETVTKYGIDRDRIYLCGNSMGGSGTLGFGLRHGEIFAAVKANVPAHVDHACDRMGWTKGLPADVKLADPPILVDYSAPNDKWSLGHERLMEMMRVRKYPLFLYWGMYGHANNDPIMLAKNDLIHSFDWLSVRKSEIYPVFTSASSDTPSAWPDRREVEAPGQVNAFFRWSDAADTADGACVTLFLKDLGSKFFATPSEATATVSLRRLRTLEVRPGDRFAWTFGARSGTTTVGADGVLMAEKLRIAAKPTTLAFRRL